MSKTSRHYWTPEERDAVLARIAAGESVPQIAVALGVHVDALESRVRHWKRLGPTGDYAATAPANVHAGLELTGQSTRVDGEGNVQQRWDLARLPASEPAPIPDGMPVTSVSTLQRDGVEVLRWTRYDAERAARDAAAREAVKAFVADYVRPAEETPAPSFVTSPHLKNYFNIGDAHVGMLAWGEEVGASFDLKIAERELVECTRQLVARSPNAATCEITNLGDWWHAQNSKATTPNSGNSLDVDGRYGKVVRVGIAIAVAMVEAALKKHERVTFRTIRGNHDPEQSLWLQEVLRAWFRNDARVHIPDAYKFYQFDHFGRNLVMWGHGDGAAVEQLPDVMAALGAQWISETRYRFAWTGHVHSKNSREFGTCLWESWNTLAGKDAWHAWKAYNARQRLTAVTLHAEWGEDSRTTVGVERVRAALEARAA